MAQNFSEDTRQRIADLRAGCLVERAAAANVTATDLFHIVGGNILLTGFYGEITVAQAVAQVIAINLIADAGTNVPLGSNSAEANGYVAGRMCYLPAATGAVTWTAECGACPINVGPSVTLSPGTIRVTSSGDQTTGRMKWALWYVPIEDGAYVVAV